MATAASRPGGKFGGKFSGRGKTSLPSSANSSSKSSDLSHSNIGADEDSSTKNKITMEMIQSKRAKIKRHEVFDKLDLAESMVLDILNVAKDTTKGFEFLASPYVSHHAAAEDAKQDKSTKMEIDDDSNHEEEGQEEKIKKAEQEWKHKIRQNGKSYMEKLKKIHDLLLPHSDLVVNYGSIEMPQEGKNSEIKTTSEKSGDEDGKTNKKKTNMYASRLEMRLAIDKKNLLDDMVELEKRMLNEEMNDLKGTISDSKRMNDNNISIPTDDNTNKRKREEE
mmetsp:Transcript_23401/g.34813  ORF Transcript_23401/g.34813 Transcript_23401/m.34813 type:complete len:279 (+) Transcript_23401:106-942(+)